MDGWAKSPTWWSSEWRFHSRLQVSRTVLGRGARHRSTLPRAGSGCPMVSLAWETQVVVRCHKSPSCGMKLDMWKTKRNITSTLWNLPSKIPIHKLKSDQNQEWNTEASVKDRTAYIYSPVSPFLLFWRDQTKTIVLNTSEYQYPSAHTSIFTPFSCSEIYLSPPHRPSNHQKDQKGINQWWSIWIDLYIIYYIKIYIIYSTYIYISYIYIYIK